MVRISTIYDSELKQKVFMVRGDESYARSTNVELVVGTITVGELEGLKIAKLTANLYRTTGTSKVVFYDGEEVLGIVNVTSSSTKAELSNVHLSYMTEHNLRAEYMGNNQCLGSKSKSVNVYREVPSGLAPKITYTHYTQQFNYNSNLDVSGTAKIINVSLTDTNVDVYLDGIFVETLTTDENGAFSTTLTDVSEGSHTIRTDISTDGTTYNDATHSGTINKGCVVTITDYPSTILNGGNNTVKVLVQNFQGNVLPNRTIAFNSTTETADENGIATFNVTSMTSGNYSASCYGSSSQSVQFNTFTPTDIDLEFDDTTSVATITIDGIGTKNRVPVVLSVDGVDTTYYTDNYGIITKSVDVSENITASILNYSKTIAVTKRIAYWVDGEKYNWNPIYRSKVTEYSHYIELENGGEGILFNNDDKTSQRRIIISPTQYAHYNVGGTFFIGLRDGRGLHFSSIGNAEVIVEFTDTSMKAWIGSRFIGQTDLEYPPIDYNPVLKFNVAQPNLTSYVRFDSIIIERL